MVFRIVPFRFYTFSLFSFEGIRTFKMRRKILQTSFVNL